MLTRVWVDYNDLVDGRCTTLRRFVEGQVFSGERVLTYDYDGITCEGTVETADHLVVVALDLDTMASEVPCEDAVKAY